MHETVALNLVRSRWMLRLSVCLTVYVVLTLFVSLVAFS